MKYYTPEIEEFHVGFEYEWNNSNEDDVWKTSVADNEDCYHAVQDIINNLDRKYRVKYLDKEDIESLGFEYQDGKMIKDYSDDFIYKPNNNLQYNLTYVYEQNILRIHVEDLVYFEESYNYLFQGTIKNKSELKKLLNQNLKYDNS